MERGRTVPRGGPGSHGETCRAYHDSDHSWKNRHGPKGPQDQAAPWRDDHTRLLRPGPHFLGTLPRPAARSALARRHPKPLDNLLCRSSAAALQELALEPRCIGGRIGMVGVRQTWTRELRDPPHGPDSVAGGGLSAQGTWLPARHDFRVHVTPRARSCRAPFRAQRHKTDLCARVDETVWNKDEVVHCAPVGTGTAAFS